MEGQDLRQVAQKGSAPDLAGIQDAVRIEGGLDSLHERDDVARERIPGERVQLAEQFARFEQHVAVQRQIERHVRDDHRAVGSLGDADVRSPRPGAEALRPRAWLLDVRSVLVLLPVLPGQVPRRVHPMPAAHLLQEGLGSRVPREADLLHEMGLRALHEDGVLQGLPHGA